MASGEWPCYSQSMETPVTYRDGFERLLRGLRLACQEVYRERLVTLAVFGSVGRGTPRPDSDVDILIVATALPRGRMGRMAEFAAVEEKLTPLLCSLHQEGIATTLSPVIKEPAEVKEGSWLFLDMVEDARLLYDRDNFFARYLTGLKSRLAALGARKVYRGGAWYWVLKEDYQPGEVFDL